MAKKRSKYQEDRVYIPIDLFEDDDTYAFIKKNFEKQNEPKADFLLPAPGSDDLITVIGNENPIGEIPKKYESKFNLNIDNSRKGYISIDEDEEVEGAFTARVVLVVSQEITDDDVKLAKRNMYMVIGMALLIIIVLAIVMFVRGQIIDGLICIAALAFLVYMVFIKKGIKSERFYKKK